MTKKNSYLSQFMIFSAFLLVANSPATAQQFTCSNQMINSNGSALTAPLAKALLAKKQRKYQQAKTRVRTVKLESPANPAKINKLKKQLRIASTQISALKKLIASCYSADSGDIPKATPPPKQDDTLSHLTTEDIFIWGYGTLTLYKNKPEKGKKIAVTTTLINNQGDVTTKHFGPVSGEETRIVDFISTKGPGYFWRKNKPNYLCPMNSDCKQQNDLRPIDMTSKGNVLFMTYEESPSENPAERKPDYFHFNAEVSNLAKRVSRLAQPIEQRSIFPENLLDDGTVIAGVSSPLIDQWFVPFNIMTAPLNIESALMPSLVALEEQLLTNLGIASSCKLSNARALSITTLKVAEDGTMTGSFMDNASCFTTNPLDGSSIEVPLPPITAAFRTKGQKVSIVNESLIIPDQNDDPQNFIFLVHATATNGVSAGSFMDPISKKVMIIYPDRVEQVAIEFSGVSRGLLDTEATDGVPPVITSVNSSGQFVGTRPLFYKAQQKVEHLSEGYLGSKGSVVSIDSLIPKSLGFAVESAEGINDCGAIVGGIKDLKKNEYYGYRLAPSACGY